MTVQYSEIQELLRNRADLNTRLNLMPYDGTPEIKIRGDGKYLYVRKRVAGKQTSTVRIQKNFIICSCAMPKKPVISGSLFAPLTGSLPQPGIPRMICPLML